MLNAFVQTVLLPAWILNEALARAAPGIQNTFMRMESLDTGEELYEY